MPVAHVSRSRRNADEENLLVAADGNLCLNAGGVHCEHLQRIK
jgi:hypothetical protein